MIDTLLRLKQESLKSNIRQCQGRDGKYGFVTLHGPSNVDSKEVLTEILSTLEVIHKELVLVNPVHLRTANRMKEFGFWNELRGWKNLKLIEPLGYLDSLRLMTGRPCCLRILAACRRRPRSWVFLV